MQLVYNQESSTPASILVTQIRDEVLQAILMLGKNEGESRSGQLKMRGLDSTTDSMDMNLGKLQETAKEGEPGVLQSMKSQSWT